MNKLYRNSIIPSFLICIILCFASFVFGESPAAPTLYNTYDGFPPGSRAGSMGMAFCAVAGDPADVYFNPAGLSEVTANMFSITYEVTRQSELSTDQIFSSEILKNKNFIFLCLTGSKAAFSWRPLSNYSVRKEDGSDWDESQVKVNMYTVSASHVHSQVFSSGLNLSYLTGQIAQSGMTKGVPFIKLKDGNGFTIDYGMLFTAGSQLKLGINLQNIAGFLWWDGYEKEQLPFILRTGFAFQVSQFMTFAGDWEKKYYRKADIVSITHFGLEQNLGNVLQLRGGIFGDDLNNKETTHITAGIGYVQNNYGLALSWEKYRVNFTDVYKYVISLNVPISS